MTLPAMLRIILTRIKKGRLPIVISGIALSLFMSFLYIYRPIFLLSLDNKLYDALLRWTYNRETSKVPVIVDLDEESLAQLGQWPWPRYRIALLLEKIRRLGALSIGLDIMFSEPDRTSPRILQNDLFRDLKISMEFRGLPEALMDNDKLFANILSQGPFVLGYNFYFDGEKKTKKDCFLHPLNAAFLKSPAVSEETKYLLTASDVMCNLEILSKAALSSGFLNTVTDVDGILRRTPLVIEWNGKFYPSLSLATLMQAMDTKQCIIKVTSRGIESLRLGKTIIPLDAKGYLLLHYRGKGKTFKYLSARDLFNDVIPKGSLQGKIVFVGSTAAGLKVVSHTPFDAMFPGVEAHATVVDNILQKDFLSKPDWVLGLELLLILACGILSTLLLTWIRAGWSLLALGAGALGMLQGAIWMLETKSIFVSPLMPLIILGSNFSVLTLLKFWREESEKRQLRGIFQKYVSPDVVDKLIRDPAKVQLGGEEKVLSVLFIDLAGFTTYSERLGPHAMVTLLSEYFTEMTEQVFANQGTLKEYVADEMMAIFGAPVERKDHAERACAAGLAMQERLRLLRQTWSEMNRPALRARVGINSGNMLVGNLGSPYRFSYGVLGDHVNLASRLEGLNGAYGTEILIGENTARLVRTSFQMREVDWVRVKGRVQPVGIYELIAWQGTSLPDDRAQAFQCYAAGLDSYRQQRWQEALDHFERALQFWPEDGPSRVMAQRCRTHQESPPEGEWDGVFQQISKK